MGDLFPLSDYVIRVLTMLGGWLAPPVTILGTLWLARRAEKPRLHVRVAPRASRGNIDGGLKHRVAWFSVTNVGQGPTSVEGVGFIGRVGWRRVRWFRRPSPVLLEAGKSLEQRINWWNLTGTDFADWRCLRAIVVTPAATKTMRIGKQLRTVLREWREDVEVHTPSDL